MRLSPLLLVSSLAACKHAAPEPAAPPAEEAAEAVTAGPATELSARMQDHYTFATAILSAAIDGDFDAARARAAELAEMDTPTGLPVTWTAGFAAMRAHAATVAAAGDDADLAMKAATLGRQCAACHTNLKPPEIPASELAQAGWLPSEESSAHALATHQMWVGLFFPDEETYAAGAEALGGPDVASAQPELAALAADAVAASSPADRTAVFGRVVATCSACHDASSVELTLP